MTPTTLRIASYNIRKARGLDQRVRPGRTLDVINGLEADVVVLQEADRRLGTRPPALPRAMIEAHTDLTLIELSANGTSLGWHGNAVLARDAALVRATDRLDLPGLEPRGAVMVDLSIGAGLRLIGAHLGLRRRDRVRQLRALRGAAAEDGATVIAGDFNEWSDTRGMEPLEDLFVVHSPGRSFHARRPIAALDRFAVTEDLTLRDVGVAQGSLARRASDHLPVWSDVAIPARALRSDLGGGGETRAPEIRTS